MRLEQVAIMAEGGPLLGQGMLGGRVLLAPLHVLDASTPATVWVRGRDGRMRRIRLAGRVAEDINADMALFRVERNPIAGHDVAIASEGDLEHLAHAEMPVDVMAAHPDSIDPGRPVSSIAIRCMARASEYTYRTSSGRSITATDVRALFLSGPLPAGWSGAPVFARGTPRVVGFVHGNAEANGHAAICLVPREESAVIGALRRLDPERVS